MAFPHLDHIRPPKGQRRLSQIAAQRRDLTLFAAGGVVLGKPHDQTRSAVSQMKHHPQMDGVRAIACMVVLSIHCIGLNSGLTLGLVGVPKTGVWLFFVLSAFLLTLQLLEQPKQVGTFIDYAIARFLRIWPLFLGAVVFYYFTGMLGIAAPSDIWHIATLQSSAGHLWTIPVEIEFYALLPLFIIGFCFLQSRWESPAVSVGILAVIFCGCLVLFRLFPVNFDVAEYLFTFGCGIIAAMASRLFGPPPQRTLFSLVSTSILLWIAIITAMKIPSIVSDPEYPSDKHFVFGPIFAVFCYASYLSSNGWSRTLSCRWLVVIGNASYSIYLFHWAFAVWFANLVFPFGGLLAIVVSILIGVASYKLIEIPIFRLRSKLSRHWRGIPGLAVE